MTPKKIIKEIVLSLILVFSFSTFFLIPQIIPNNFLGTYYVDSNNDKESIDLKSFTLKADNTAILVFSDKKIINCTWFVAVSGNNFSKGSYNIKENGRQRQFSMMGKGILYDQSTGIIYRK